MHCFLANIWHANYFTHRWGFSSVIVKHGIKQELICMHGNIFWALWGLFSNKSVYLYLYESINNHRVFCSCNECNYLDAWLELSSTSSWPPSARTSALWLTHDRWLLYGSRHRWTCSLNLPLYQAHPHQLPPFSIISTVSCLYMCVGVWNLFIFMHAFSAGFASALNIPISARLWDEEREHSLHGCHSHPEFSLHFGAHLSAGLIHGEEG